MFDLKFQTVGQIPMQEWRIQGTIYSTPNEAKFAAAKLFCITTGVRVKRVREGWALLYWNRQVGY